MTNKIIDLGWGHPEFLQEYWELSNDYAAFSFDTISRYQIDAGLDLLRDSIASLHNEEGNALVGSKHIIIGNGATQLLRGLMHCLPGKTVSFPAPYYSMLPALVESVDCDYVDNHSDIGIITARNNPDGSVFTESNLDAAEYIHDIVYNWSQYGNVLKDYDAPIMVNSMSKSFGHPGLRVGWALVADDKLASDLADFVLRDSCGVSIISQLMAVNVISKQLSKPKKKRCFYYGRYELKYRWALLKRTLGATDIESINRLGMFALLKIDTPDAEQYMLQKYGIKTIAGPKMGLASDVVRVNIGSATKDFEEFISRLSENTKYENPES